MYLLKNHSLCGCFDDIGECCFAYFCTCCYACDLANRLNEPCWSLCYGGLVPMRTMIRTQRKIDGNICSDFFTVSCCPLCALVQMGKEVKETAPLI
jgi:Cys-rich protein (TIGR01571 family)